MQSFAPAILATYVAAWWLAIWIVFRERFGIFVWIPVAYAAFGFPMFVADLTTTGDWRDIGGALIAVWMTLPLAVDTIWSIK
ncbi:MAG: hypothetical protein JWM11_4153 [Planctomycetaceae bacterium]|nr:hypothetical protein [Planctomycetaceae bacterium]